MNHKEEELGKFGKKGKIYNSQRALSRELGVYSDVVSKALKNNKLLLGYEITKVTK
ncbi:hypothetical protein LP1502b_23 [Lactococcus phage LP1502b]|uniref:Uncharacterized protein n=3 Tax=Skunavirus LP1502a TaxID=2845413 RepID=A0A2K8IVB1_9CAUD|nr:hypothetical protein HYP51_gp23 [Lactococcus phage LP1502a]ATE84484.1 hypothetical protein LP1502a_23 [Lactococcus phage LP1502a]ATE84536.1 hypothetical protein LP1502b_23 [Lactococcus phage LP1502b]ATE84588.1 hypothetical protein LP1502c_23 [Lactococcus phage LP1502c]